MSTPKFRKSDQYYQDEYDRLTISHMKEKEDEWIAKLKLVTDEDLLFRKQMVAHINIRETGTHFAQNKRHQIGEWILRDERKDRLIAQHPTPPPPYCQVCDAYMTFCDYDFVNDDQEIQYIFSCGKGTKHNAILEANGKKLSIPEQYCPYCNGAITTTVKKTKSKITSTNSCTVCTWTDMIVFDLSPRKQVKILPIVEEERKAYCTDFKNSKGFLHDLQALASISDREEMKYDLSKIQLLKVTELAKKLDEALQAAQFTKLQFEQPKITGHMTIRFSTLDTSERIEQRSVKALKKIITETLFPTNWRLMTTEISYRLGYLTGQFKGVDQKEDLIKIAAEIGSRP